MGDYSKSFDARSLTPAQARTVVQLCAQIGSLAASVKSLAAAVAAEGCSYKAEGYRSPDEQLARDTGMSPTQARRALATGRRMLDQPDVAAAALGGELSAEQAQAVAAGAEANPARTAELLEVARQASLPELNEAVARARRESVDLEARRRAIHARRRLSRFTDVEGEYHAHLSGNPEDGITIDQVLSEIRRKLTTSRRERQVPNERFDTLDYDAVVALFDLACGKDSEISLYDLIDVGLFPQFDPTSLTPRPAPSSEGGHAAAGPSDCTPSQDWSEPVEAGDLLSLLEGRDSDPGGGAGRPAKAGRGEGLPPSASPPAAPRRRTRGRLAGRPAKIIVRVDLDTLLRGYPTGGETCDCPGYGPVPVSLINDLIAGGQARLAAVLTKSQEVRSVYLDRRHPNEYQKTALDYLYPVCAVKGCNTRAGLEADHRDDWAKTHYTVIDLLDYLCWHHHQLESRQGWALVPGHGKRDFVPPDHPRHPHHREPGGRIAAAGGHPGDRDGSPRRSQPRRSGPAARRAPGPSNTPPTSPDVG